jgi:hypothetical protein
MLCESLVAFLLEQSAITSQLADPAGIQPPPAPVTPDAANYPCITYESTSDDSELAGDGPVGIATTRYVFNCYGLRKLAARRLAETLKTVLNGYSGDLPGGIYVEWIKTGISDRFEDGSQIYCSIFQALICYRDA